MTEFTSKLPRDLSIEKSRRMSRGGGEQKQEQTKQRVYLAQPASHCGYKFKEARRSINAVRAPPSQGGLGTSRPPGPRLSFHPSLPPPFFFLPCTPPILSSRSAQWQPTSAGKCLRTCSGRGPGRHLLRYLASSPCMAAAVALWGGWGCLRVWEGYFRGPGQSTLTAEAVTVLRPARLGGGGAAVTTVRPPAPPTAPGPPKHWSAQTRPGLRKAHALTRQLQYAQAQL